MEWYDLQESIEFFMHRIEKESLLRWKIVSLFSAPNGSHSNIPRPIFSSI